jgi:hypothetical protein
MVEEPDNEPTSLTLNETKDSNQTGETKESLIWLIWTTPSSTGWGFYGCLWSIPHHHKINVEQKRLRINYP